MYVLARRKLDVFTLEPGGYRAVCEIQRQHRDDAEAWKALPALLMKWGEWDKLAPAYEKAENEGQPLRYTLHTQGGTHEQCTRGNCKSKPTYRVILGRHRFQAYVCTRHLSWGIDLDSVSDTVALEAGIMPKFGGRDHVINMRETTVVPTLRRTLRTNFARTLWAEMGKLWPHDGRWS